MDRGERRERKDVRRNLERVLQAAHALFRERGMDVTMEEIAQQAGVGVGTVYRRFPSKEHLFAAVRHAACADAEQCLVEAAQSEPDPVEKLRAVVLIHCHRSMQHAALLDLRPSSTSGYLHGPQAGHDQLYTTLHQLLQHVIIEGQQRELLRHGDPVVLAALCVEVLHPRAIQQLQRFISGDTETLADHLVQFMLYGLSKRSVRNG